MENKIIDFAELPEAVAGWRRRLGRKGKIVLCHGCFDLVHPGHIRHLRFARGQGEMLVVSITPDACVNKASSRPLVPQDLRAENLAALEIVDAVLVAPRETGVEPIEIIRPDIYVKGREYAISNDPRFLREKSLVEEFGGRVAYSSGDVVFSSTEFIRDSDLDTANAEKLRYIHSRYGINRGSMERILADGVGVSVLLVGEALIDDYHHCEGLGISQQSPVLSISLKHRRRFVGGIGGVALHLASLGAEVTLLTSVNEAGGDYQFFHGTLSDRGVRVVNVHDERRPVVVRSHYFVDSNQVLEVDSGFYSPLDSNLRTLLAREFARELRGAPACVILSDFGYGMLSEDLLKGMATSAQSRGVVVIGDITLTNRTQVDKFRGVDIFVASELEIRSCLHDYESGLSVLVSNFYHDTDIKELYLALGDGSCIYFRRPDQPGIHNMESVHIPHLPLRLEDRMGVGEAFLAAVSLARAQGTTQFQSIYFASLCAAAQSHRSGNTALDRELVYRLVGERDYFDEAAENP